MSSIFNRLGAIITARDLLEPLEATVASSDSVANAIEFIARHRRREAWASLVREEDEVVGWTEYHELSLAARRGESGDQCVRDVMHIIKPGDLVSADMSGLQLFRLLTKHPDGKVWFVVDQNAISGTVQYDCLFRPEFRIFIFAFGIELEQQALKLCVARGAEESWNSLPRSRKDKALRAFARRQGLSEQEVMDTEADWDSEELLTATMFIDKTLILKARSLLPLSSQDALSKTFHRLEEIRNRCAHPDLYDEPFVQEPEELFDVLESSHALLDSINEALLPEPPTESSI